jgi:hypothetical protein
VTQAVPARLVHFGHYVLTPDNTLAAQVDGPGVDSSQWQPGDVFQTVFDLAIPTDVTPGTYALATALYYYPEVERVRLSNGQDLLFVLPLEVSTP